ncbi:hypothetical protein [Nonomuraea sp. B12E4]|uniref:hypothetical protein n=1 Tax=Nonomuraea sp. B12E4 TaxID=3153564 RepID=UPI00325FBD5A
MAGQILMAAHGLALEDLPAAAVSERVLRRATPGDIAEAIGFSYDAATHDVDLVVIGAGLAAAVYGASEGLVTVLFDAAGAGGQAATSSRIENYLGFTRGIRGSRSAAGRLLTELARNVSARRVNR